MFRAVAETMHAAAGVRRTNMDFLLLTLAWMLLSVRARPLRTRGNVREQAAHPDAFEFYH
jgi:hypothetical protein